MTRTIWKHVLSFAEPLFSLEMRKQARILHVANQRGLPVLWEVGPAHQVIGDAPRVEHRHFRWVTTGEFVELSDQTVDRYVGTVQLDEGEFVLHLFEVDGPW